MAAMKREAVLDKDSCLDLLLASPEVVSKYKHLAAALIRAAITLSDPTVNLAGEALDAYVAAGIEATRVVYYDHVFAGLRSQFSGTEEILAVLDRIEQAYREKQHAH